MIELSTIFDAGYYSATNPDLAAVGLTTGEELFNHFNQSGVNEGRGFSPYVDLKFYAEANPDLAAAGLLTGKQLLDHLIDYGINEKRRFSENVDLNFYGAANPDLAAAGLTTGEELFDHLINFGAQEGRELTNQTVPAVVPGLPPLPELATARELSASQVDWLVATGLESAKDQLKDFVTDPDFASFAANIKTAFGEEVELDAAKAVIQNMADGVGLPGIEVVSAEDLGGEWGAFDALTNTTYLSREFLAQNANDPDAIAKVLLEEIGHSVDARLNTLDTPGDEGAMFAALVQGEELSQSEISALQAEDDQAIITINGQDILVEHTSSGWDLDVYDWNWNWKGNDFQSKRSDSVENGVNLDWGNGSVSGLADYFIVHAGTESYFDANKTYKFRVKADDYFQLWVSPDGGGTWSSLTNGWESDAYKDHHNYDTFKEYSFTPSVSGYHNVIAYVAEIEGDAYFDLSWDNGWDKNQEGEGLNYSDFDWTVQYMYEEMRDNAQSDAVKRISHANWNANNFYSDDINWNDWRGDSSKNNAYAQWTVLVVDKVGPWDHKPKIENARGLKKDNDYWFPIWGDSRHEYFYDIWSNIHFGYVGKAAGFTADELQNGSALNDSFKGNRDQNDVNAIALGIALWNETGGDVSRLTPELLRQKIVSNGSSLTRTDRIVNGQ